MKLLYKFLIWIFKKESIIKLGYLARDSDNKLYMYSIKPNKSHNIWVYDKKENSINILDNNNNLFPEVKWGDKEPREVIILIKKI